MKANKQFKKVTFRARPLQKSCAPGGGSRKEALDILGFWEGREGEQGGEKVMAAEGGRKKSSLNALSLWFERCVSIPLMNIEKWFSQNVETK